MRKLGLLIVFSFCAVMAYGVTANALANTFQRQLRGGDRSDDFTRVWMLPGDELVVTLDQPEESATWLIWGELPARLEKTREVDSRSTSSESGTSKTVRIQQFRFTMHKQQRPRDCELLTFRSYKRNALRHPLDIFRIQVCEQIPQSQVPPVSVGDEELVRKMQEFSQSPSSPYFAFSGANAEAYREARRREVLDLPH